MARKERTVVIDAEGRDKDRVYLLREMPATQAEAWATRLLLALGKGGVEVPEGFFSMGMAGIAAIGIRALGGLQWDIAKPLLDEMMTCVRFKPNATDIGIRPPQDDDIEEVATRLRLRDEVIDLHLGFSVRGFLSNLTNSAQVEQATDQALGLGPDIETSPKPSVAPYRPKRRR